MHPGQVYFANLFCFICFSRVCTGHLSTRMLWVSLLFFTAGGVYLANVVMCVVFFIVRWDEEGDAVKEQVTREDRAPDFRQARQGAVSR